LGSLGSISEHTQGDPQDFHFMAEAMHRPFKGFVTGRSVQPLSA